MYKIQRSNFKTKTLKRLNDYQKKSKCQLTTGHACHKNKRLAINLRILWRPSDIILGRRAVLEQS